MNRLFAAEEEEEGSQPLVRYAELRSETRESRVETHARFSGNEIQSVFGVVKKKNVLLLSQVPVWPKNMNSMVISTRSKFR